MGASKAETIVTTVTKVERLRRSQWGNPAFRLTLEDGRRVDTAPDTGDAYVVCDGWHDRRVTLEIDRWGRAFRIELRD